MNARLFVVYPFFTAMTCLVLLLLNDWWDVNFTLSFFFLVQMRVFILDIADQRGSDLAALPQHIVSIISWNSYSIGARCRVKNHKSGRKSQEVADAAAQSTFTRINALKTAYTSR